MENEFTRGHTHGSGCPSLSRFLSPPAVVLLSLSAVSSQPGVLSSSRPVRVFPPLIMMITKPAR